MSEVPWVAKAVLARLALDSWLTLQRKKSWMSDERELPKQESKSKTGKFTFKELYVPGKLDSVTFAFYWH